MGKKRLLLVDDEETTLYSVKMALDTNRYQIFHDKTTAAALARLKQAKDIDLVILDIMLDHRCGFDILDKISEMRISSPVIILSALNDARAAATAFKKGALDYVVKPFHSKELEDAVEAALIIKK